MTETQKDFWFPAKRYGWGWGPPVKWQGWLVLVIYVALVVGTGFYYQPRKHPVAFITCVVVATALFMVIAAVKGEKPLAWRWGNKLR
jgi:hypothetical protein